MNLSELKEKISPPALKKPVFSKKQKILIISILAGLAIAYAGTFVWAKSYDHRLAPNLWIGETKIGGLNSDEAKREINTAVDKILASGLQLAIDGTVGTIPLSSAGAETGDYVVFDVNKTVEEAFKKHRSSLPIFQPFKLLYALIRKTEMEISTSINQEKMFEMILKVFPQSLQPAVDAGFSFKQENNLWTVTVTPAAKGLTIPVGQLFAQLYKQLSSLDPQPIVLARAVEEPGIIESEAEKLTTAAEAAINGAPYSISFEEKIWSLEAVDLITVIKPTFDQKNKIILSASVDGLAPIFEKIAAEIEKPATDARLLMENDRITDFQTSANGLTIDRQKTAAALTEIIQNPENKIPCPLSVNIIEPAVKMESVNDLGIKEVLGVGTSNYSNSPTNRIKNIRNGVRLLNGLLIKPGEEFSLVSALKPITIDNGYLSELVIKGTEIVPEVGGGLCQIGTTTFRAALNSGLPITARSNHSLVINHYADPTNGNPGTDATIYDPAPDLKFINDTGNYLLFQAEMDEANTMLYFSFWGTSDGRKGSYTPPTLIRWIGVGPEQITETLALEPGVKKCQNAFVGADATFTYTVKKPDGTKTETVFDSHYRPLPKICLLGVAELTPPPEEIPTVVDETTESTTNSTTNPE
ncbi:MAG: VanW family protein [Candidatus Uhrbacteria bacterium]